MYLHIDTAACGILVAAAAEVRPEGRGSQHLLASFSVERAGGTEGVSLVWAVHPKNRSAMAAAFRALADGLEGRQGVNVIHEHTDDAPIPLSKLSEPRWRDPELEGKP